MKHSELRQLIREEMQSLMENVRFTNKNGKVNTTLIQKKNNQYGVHFDTQMVKICKYFMETTYEEGWNDGYAEGAKATPNKSFSYKGGFYK